MEDRRNGTVDCTYKGAWVKPPVQLLTEVSKKDKRKHHIAQRLGKLDDTLMEEKNDLYHGLLHGLQSNLAALQHGTNGDFIQRRNSLEASRDYELTRLRLWEEYQVKRVETEYNEDTAKARESYDTMIKLLKEKFYDKLQRQVKQLKEDKLLLNLVNATSWNTANGGTGRDDPHLSALAAASGGGLSGGSSGGHASMDMALHDRRSLRKRDFHSRFGTTTDHDDLSDSGAGHSSANGFLRGLGASAGYHSSSTKRRRHYATRYSSNDDMSSGMASNPAANLHSGSNNGGLSKLPHANGASSGNDSNLSDKDYDQLNHLIMNNEDGVILSRASAPPTNRSATRGSHKQFVGVQGLRTEELNEDLTLLRSVVSKKDRS